MVESGDSLAVALSGGPDSVALLLVLLQIRPILDCSLSAIHFHHGVRGGEADQDEEFVRRLCERLEVPLRVGRRDGSQPLAGNLEAQLRDARYAYFVKELRGQAELVATGHTLDDQAETVLLKLARGAGPQGLAGIHPLRWEGSPEGPRLKVIRPLLEVARDQVLQYLEERQAEYRCDSSNLDLSFDRNWVRQRLLPSLAGRLNPKIKQALGRTGEWNRQLVEAIEQTTTRFLGRQARLQGEDLLVPAQPLRELATFWQICTIRALAACIAPECPLESEHVSQIQALLESQPGRHFQGPGNLRVWREREQLVFSRGEELEPFEIEIEIPGQVRIAQRDLCLRVFPSQTAEPEAGCFRLIFGGERVKLRTLRPGDLFVCLRESEERSVKVVELLQQRGVPARQREQTLILEGAGEILWVEGLGLSAASNPGPDKEPLLDICVQVSNETFESGRFLK